MTKPITWFGTWLPLVKLAQAVCLSVVILLFLDGREQWIVYNIIFFFAFLGLFYALFSIFFRYFELNGSRQASFNLIECTINAFCSLICFGLAGFLLWDVWNMRQGPHKFKYHSRLPPHNIGQSAWVRRCVIVENQFVTVSKCLLGWIISFSTCFGITGVLVAEHYDLTFAFLHWNELEVVPPNPYWTIFLGCVCCTLLITAILFLITYLKLHHAHR